MISTLRHLVNILVREVEPDRIILFGSRARGENEEQSDYDICILKTGVMQRRNLAKGRELIKLIKCTELTLAKIALGKKQMGKLFNSQS
ncbi:MAG: hypothetical protein GWP06_11945 [Actinobacteria bacterium]|nr:hypothetical protein [Actinomycetota bacterium]